MLDEGFGETLLCVSFPLRVEMDCNDLSHKSWLGMGLRVHRLLPTRSAEPRRISKVAGGTEIRTERWHSMTGAQVKFSWNPLGSSAEGDWQSSCRLGLEVR